MTSLDIAPTRTKLNSLTGLRFYAAFVVLLRHTIPESAPVPVLNQLSMIGVIGVGFFFVLSGFILAWTTAPETSSRDFYLRRVSRIYPLHLLTTVAAVVLWISLDKFHWFSALLSVVLLQAWGPDTWRQSGGNGPSWSLSAEAFFYAVFPFLIKPLRRSSVRRCAQFAALVVILMCVWTLVYIAISYKDLPGATAISTYTNPLYRLGEFVLGILIAVAMRQGWRLRITLRQALYAAVGAYASLAAINYAVIRSGVDTGTASGIPLGILDLMFLPVTCVLVVAAAGSDLADAPSPIAGRWHVRLGEWSFALYLIQMTIIVPAFELLPDDHSHLVGLVACAVVMAVSVAVSAALFHWFERPVEAALRRRWIGPRPSTP